MSRPSSPLDAKASTRCPSHTCITGRRGKPADGTMLRTDALPSGPARLRTSRAGQLHVRFFCRRGGDEADRFTLTYSRCQTANGSSRPQGVGPEVQQCWIGYPSRSKRRWWRRTGSNRRPSACKADALPAELRPRPSSGVLHHQDTKAPRGRRGANAVRRANQRSSCWLWEIVAAGAASPDPWCLGVWVAVTTVTVGHAP